MTETEKKKLTAAEQVERQRARRKLKSVSRFGKSSDDGAVKFHAERVVGELRKKLLP